MTEAAPEVSAPAATENTDTSNDGSIENLEDSVREEGDEQKPAASKKWKLKVNDVEEELDEPELLRRAQVYSSADEKFKYASKMRKEAAALESRYNAAIEKLRTDPKHLWESEVQAKEWATNLLLQDLKLEMMSPEQRRAHELEQRAAALEEELNQHKLSKEEEAKKLAEERQNELKSQATVKLDTSIAEALHKAGVKHMTPNLVRRVAQKMLAYHAANDGELLDANVAVKAALDDRVPEVNEFLEGLSPDEFEAKLPATFLDAVRKYFVSRVNSPIAQNQRQERSFDSPSPRKKRDAMSTDDFFKKLESKFG
jgi:hypothetical protein